jgi:hypothetical protein
MSIATLFKNRCTSKGSSDVRFVAARTVPDLAPGATSTETVTVIVPSSTPLGTYYLLACADDMWAVLEGKRGEQLRGLGHHGGGHRAGSR